MGRRDRRRRRARRRAAALHPAAGRAAGHGQRAAGAAGRAVHGPEGGRRLGGVAGRRGEPRARGRPGQARGRAGNLGLGAQEARREHPRHEHAHRDIRGIRRHAVVSDPRVDPHARARASKGAALRGHAGRRTAVRLGRVRGVLPDRRLDLRRALRAAVVRVRGLAVARGRPAWPRRRGARVAHGRRGRHDEATHRTRSDTGRSSARRSEESRSGWSAWRCR